MASCIVESKPNIDTIPPEIQSQILLHLVETNVTIRLRPVKPRPPPPPRLSVTETFKRYDAWYRGLSPTAEAPPPAPWPEEWSMIGMLELKIPAEQGCGRYGLTAPPHPDARSPVIARRIAGDESRRQRLADQGLDEEDPWRRGGNVIKSEDLNDWGEGVIPSRSTKGVGCCSGITAFMLLNRDLRNLARKVVYGTNTFSFPNVETLQHFALNLSLEARSGIKQIAINACGEALYTTMCTHEYWKFEMEIPGMDLFYPLSRFSSLEEVVLAGIGPGVRKKIGWTDMGDGTQMLSSGGRQTEEVAEQWKFKCIDLIARLVGIDAGEEIDTHCLFGGTVICKTEDGLENMLGALRLLGTRIVARDVEYVLEDNERIVDVAAALAQAKEAKAENDRWKEEYRRIQRSLGR